MEGELLFFFLFLRKNRNDDDDDKNRSEIPTYLAVEKGGEGETGGEKVRSFKISREAGHSR